MKCSKVEGRSEQMRSSSSQKGWGELTECDEVQVSAKPIHNQIMQAKPICVLLPSDLPRMGLANIGNRTVTLVTGL